MNLFDLAAVGLVVLASVSGFALGLTRMALSAAAVVAGLTAAVAFAEPIGTRIREILPMSPRLGGLLGFVVVYAAVLVLFGAAAWVVRKSLGRLGLGWLDRSVGGLLGLAAALAVSAVTALGAEQLAPHDELVTESRLMAPLARLGEYGLEQLPMVWQQRVRGLLTNEPPGHLTPPPSRRVESEGDER